MNVFWQEWRMGRQSLVTWALSLVGLTIFFMLLYPSISEHIDAFLEIVKSFPPAFREALGIQYIELGAVGYYSFILLYVLLAGSVQAMNLGVSVLSAEVRDKTADFLYAKPISRPRLITAKTLSVLFQLILTNIIFSAAAWLTILTVNSQVDHRAAIETHRFLLLTGSLFLLQLFFAALGLFVSSFLARIRTVLPISLSVVFFFYVLHLLNETLQNEALAFLSPFSTFNPGTIIRNGRYETRYLLASLLLIAGFIAWTYRAYMRKDLPAI